MLFYIRVCSCPGSDAICSFTPPLCLNPKALEFWESEQLYGRHQCHQNPALGKASAHVAPLSGLDLPVILWIRQRGPCDPYSTDGNTETQGKGQITSRSMAELGLELRFFCYKSRALSTLPCPTQSPYDHFLSLAPFLLCTYVSGSSFLEESGTAIGVICGVLINSLNSKCSLPPLKPEFPPLQSALRANVYLFLEIFWRAKSNWNSSTMLMGM